MITFSPDGNSIPGRIPDLIAKYQEGYYIVICSRYTDGAKSEDDIVARFGNHPLEESEIEDALQIAIDLNELVKTLPTHTGLQNGTKYPDV